MYMFFVHNGKDTFFIPEDFHEMIIEGELVSTRSYCLTFDEEATVSVKSRILHST